MWKGAMREEGRKEEERERERGREKMNTKEGGGS